MENKLLPNQEVIYSKIVNNIRETNIFLTGKSGCGKTEVMKSINKFFRCQGYIVLLLDNSQIDTERPYYPLLSGIQLTNYSIAMSEVGMKLSEDSPILSNTLQIFAKRLFDKNYNKLAFLNDTEKELYDKLNLLVKKNKVLLICDNIHYWDKESLSFINILFRNEYIYETLTTKLNFILCFTENQKCTDSYILESLQRDYRFLNISFGELSLKSFKDALKLLGLNKNLSEDEYVILYNLIDGHIQVMLEVIKEINNDRLDFQQAYQSNIDLLKPILIQRLNYLGALGSFIDETLKYASLMGISFDKLELNQILSSFQIESFDFNVTMNQAEEIFLIQKYDNTHYSFVHEIIMQVFESNIANTIKPKYYYKLAKCLQQIKPHDYLRRAYCLLKAEEELEASRIFALYLIQQFKEGSEIRNSTFDEISPRLNTFISLVEKMKQAYELYHEKEYEETFYILFSIPDIYPNDLLAEKYLLMSCCQTKSLITEKKKEAISTLLKYDSIVNVNNECDVYESILERLMICYIHYGDINRARYYEGKFISSVAKRTSYDSYSQYRLYKLFRKANALYDSELAYIKLKQSIDFFRSDILPININDLYIGLTNISCTLIKLGIFKSAYNVAIEGIELEKKYPHISYKRTQIIRSNLCIAGVLSNEMKLEKAIEIILEIQENTPIIPERIYHTINLTSLYALNNQTEKALSILKYEASIQNYQEDVEQIYHYYVVYNMIVFMHLLNITENKENYIHELQEMNKSLICMIDGSYMFERNKLIIKIINENVICDPDEWLNIVFKYKPIFQKKEIWNFFGLGYAFVGLSNWE